MGYILNKVSPGCRCYTCISFSDEKKLQAERRHTFQQGVFNSHLVTVKSWKIMSVYFALCNCTRDCCLSCVFFINKVTWESTLKVFLLNVTGLSLHRQVISRIYSDILHFLHEPTRILHYPENGFTIKSPAMMTVCIMLILRCKRMIALNSLLNQCWNSVRGVS